MQETAEPACLLLEDGTVFEGKSFGAIGTSGGEMCFNTGMTGYQEVFTDPSYHGQVLIMNSAYIGNYGVRKDDVESGAVQIKALVCKNFSHRFSRMNADENLHEYLTRNRIVSLYDIDTRALVQHIRDKGAMNGIVSNEIRDLDELRSKLQEIPPMNGLNLSEIVSTKDIYTVGNPDAEFRIAVLDFGAKKSMLRFLSGKNAFLKVFPCRTRLSDILAFAPDGIFISNGPGDPASMAFAVDTVREVLEAEIPMFGICLGHQLLALANDVPTYKMHHGHRGLNHPVKNLRTGRSEITTQNHGFGVNQIAAAQSNKIDVTHINLNDGTIEGIQVRNKPAFAVQYHPESTPGPHDSRYLFDDFINLMRKTRP